MSSRRHFLENALKVLLPAPLVRRLSESLCDPSFTADAAATLAQDGVINVREAGAVGDGVADDGPAIERAAAMGGNLQFPPGQYRVAADLALSPRLVLRKGAVLAPDAGVTIAIEGPLDAGLHQVFDVDAAISFAPGAVAEVYPHWWGARGDGVHDDAAALQAAFGARTVSLPAGKYRVTRELIAKNGLRLQGVGSLRSPDPSRDSWIFYDGPPAPDVAVLRASTAAVGKEPRSALSNVVIREIVLDGQQKAGYGLYAAYCTNDSAFSDLTVIRTTRHGLWANKIWYARFEHITARDNGGCGLTIGRPAPGWARSSAVNGIFLSNLRAHSNGLDERFDEDGNLEWGYGIGFYPGSGVILDRAVSENNYGTGVVFGLGPGASNGVRGLYLEGNGVAARIAGKATRNWGLIVIGHANARGNSVSTAYLSGAVGQSDSQSIWLTGAEPAGTVTLRDVAFGQYLRADWSRYELQDDIYYGLSHYVEGSEPQAVRRRE